MSKLEDELYARDGRELGEWKSRYPCAAWRRILGELFYLMCILAIASVSLVYIGFMISTAGGAAVRVTICGCETSTILLKWMAIALSGFIGGTTYDLKWLYHSVARQSWNADRLLWRIVVPPISGVVAVFFSFLLQAGFVNLTGAKPIGWYAALGLGFLFGYFSDNVIAYLYRMSDRFFGTTETPRPPDNSGN